MHSRKPELLVSAIACFCITAILLLTLSCSMFGIEMQPVVVGFLGALAAITVGGAAAFNFGMHLARGPDPKAAIATANSMRYRDQATEKAFVIRQLERRRSVKPQNSSSPLALRGNVATKRPM